MAKTKIGTLNEILGTRSRAVFPHRINFEVVNYNNLSKMKQWCDDNCKGIWNCEHFHALYFQFSDDYDATMFMLRWGTSTGNKLR